MAIIPAEKLEDIQNVQYGENAKIMVPFTTVPLITNGLVGDQIVSFFDCVQQILTIYYTDFDLAYSLLKPLQDAYIQASFPMIEQGFENCPSFMTPVYAKDEANLSYEGVIGYSWPNDPYAKGYFIHTLRVVKKIFSQRQSRKMAKHLNRYSLLLTNLFISLESTLLSCSMCRVLWRLLVNLENVSQEQLKRSSLLIDRVFIDHFQDRKP